MSAKELSLCDGPETHARELKFVRFDGSNNIEVEAHGHDGSVFIELDRNQAHLLKLWLEECLK